MQDVDKEAVLTAILQRCGRHSMELSADQAATFVQLLKQTPPPPSKEEIKRQLAEELFVSRFGRRALYLLLRGRTARVIIDNPIRPTPRREPTMLSGIPQPPFRITNNGKPHTVLILHTQPAAGRSVVLWTPEGGDIYLSLDELLQLEIEPLSAEDYPPGEVVELDDLFRRALDAVNPPGCTLYRCQERMFVAHILPTPIGGVLRLTQVSP